MSPFEKVGWEAIEAPTVCIHINCSYMKTCINTYVLSESITVVLL